MAFRSRNDVENWLEKPGNSIDLLREKVAGGQFSGQNAVWGRAWLERHDQLGLEQKEDAAVQRELRAIVAAEQSARWALLSVIVAVAALLIAAWPYLAELLR